MLNGYNFWAMHRDHGQSDKVESRENWVASVTGGTLNDVEKLKYFKLILQQRSQGYTAKKL